MPPKVEVAHTPAPPPLMTKKKIEVEEQDGDDLEIPAFIRKKMM